MSSPSAREPEVVRFDPALVKNWPGLPNLGNSCFMNSGIKLLAAMPDLDPFLAGRGDDDAKTRAVRTSLRNLVNFIRSGGAHGGRHGQTAHDQVQAVLTAFRGHAQLKALVNGIGNSGVNQGGLTEEMMEGILSVLGCKDEFRLKISTKTVQSARPGTPAYEAGPRKELIVGEGTGTGWDLAQVHDTGALFEAVFSRPGTFPHGGGAHASVSFFPTDIPRTVLFEVLHQAPHKALRFSDRVEVPVYSVDPAQRRETRLGGVPLEAAGASVFRGGHVWAVIRGDDGWYTNDDAKPSRRVERTELDEILDGGGGLQKYLTVIAFRRN